MQVRMKTQDTSKWEVDPRRHTEYVQAAREAKRSTGSVDVEM